MRRTIARLVANEDLNFLLTNRIPRRLATDFIGWFSRIERPLIARASIAVWRFFSDVDLSDAETTYFRSMHACFTRRLSPGARPTDPRENVLASPCDAIVGAVGRINGDVAQQIKGAPYRLSDLLGDAAAAASFRDGHYVTLRLTAGMYHHFHAPHDLIVEELTYISGDCWNVNPIALKRIERLFCKNERAAIRCRLPDGSALTLVAVAAVLVASIRLTFLDTCEALRSGGPRQISLGNRVKKGDEMGWFEQGSTIVLLLPPHAALLTSTGRHLRAGQQIAALGGGVPLPLALDKSAKRADP